MSNSTPIYNSAPASAASAASAAPAAPATYAVNGASENGDFQAFSQILLSRISHISLPAHKSNTIIPLVARELAKATADVVTTDDNIMYYNGSSWGEVTATEFGIFLREFALRLGCPETIITPYWGVDALVKQCRIDLYNKATCNKNAINFKNGTLDLDTLRFREHRRSDYFRYELPYFYDANAESPKWHSFLSEVMPDEKLQRLAQEVAGSPLAKVHTEKLPFLYGDGCNGKSVFLNAIECVFGKRNVTHYTIENITDKSGIYLSQMLGKLVNISAENGQRIADTDKLKAYISGEALMTRQLYKNSIDTSEYAPSIVCSNNLPQTDDFSSGFFRRFLFLPFTQVIPKHKINPNLSEELAAEVSGICNWVIEGCRRLRENGRYSEVQESILVAEEFRKESDAVYLFIEEVDYAPTTDMMAEKILLSNLYTRFSEWCKSNGFGVPSVKTLGKRLRKLDFIVTKGTNNQTYMWYNGAMKEKNDTPQPF